jgi:group I intron endonuclease
MKIYGVIYKVTNLVNDKRYIGKSVDFKNRLYNHLSNARKNSGYALHNAIRKYGLENFNWTIIDEAYSEDELNDKEIFWIDYYKSFRDFGLGYNLTLGGDGGKLSEETKRKIGIANGGENSSWFGKNHSEETKKKIGMGQIGKKYSEEAKRRISESRKKYVGENHPMYGRTHSEESKTKMKESHANFKGGNHPQAKPVVQLTVDGVFIDKFPSALEGAISIGKKNGCNIRACCQGVSKTAFGYKWMYEEDYKDTLNKETTNIKQKGETA